MPNKLIISGKAIIQYVSNSLISAYYNREQHEKHLNTIIMENMECLIVKKHPPVIVIKVGVLLYHSVWLRFVLFPALQTFD